MRADGKTWSAIAKAVGSSPESCRVLFHKRRYLASRLLADRKNAEWIEGGIVDVGNASD